MNPQTEQEWQFAAPTLDAARAWLATQPRERSERHFVPRSTLELNDIYFDSPDWMVFRAGFALRLRVEQDGENPSGTEITLKSLAPSQNGFARRVEISERIDDADIATVLARDSGIGQRIRELVGNRALAPLFRARTRRERLQLLEADSDLPLAEVDLDETSIEAGTGPARALTRIEVECLNAEPAALEPWVEQLRDAAQLVPVEASKFRTGLDAAGLTPTTRLDLGSEEISPTREFADAQLALLRRYFRVLFEREPHVRLGSVDAVHEMRVGARHLEVLLRLFEGSAPRWTVGAKIPLREIVKTLGAVRDADVQLAHLAERAHEVPRAELAAIAALRERLEHRRQGARAELLAALDGERVRGWIEHWTGKLRLGADERSPARATRGASAARELVRSEARALRKRADNLTTDSSHEEFHAVRKRAKRLRYAIESFASFWGAPAGDYLRALTKLQHLLGTYHDAVVRTQAFTELATGGENIPPATSFAVGKLVERDQRIIEECRRKFAKAFRRIRKRRWRALDAEMRRTAST